MNDEELTKLAIAEILRDAESFKKKYDAEFRALRAKSPVKVTPNTNFLKRTIRDTLYSNKLVNDRQSLNKRNSSGNASSKTDLKHSSHKTLKRKKRSPSSSSDDTIPRFRAGSSKEKSSSSYRKRRRSRSRAESHKSKRSPSPCTKLNDLRKHPRKDKKTDDHKHGRSDSSKRH